MKQLLTILALLFSVISYAQEIEPTEIGYNVDYDYLHAIVDTIHNHTTLAHHYHRKAYVSVNGGKAILRKKGEYFTVWSSTPMVVITRKRFKQTYIL